MQSNRDFIFAAELPGASRKIIIAPPFRVSFSIDKSINGGLNKATIKLYNIGQSNAEALSKDADEPLTIIPMKLSVGYQGRLEQVYSGQVYRGQSSREGPDIVTTLESIDGLQAIYGYSSKVVDGGDVIDAILADVEGIARGKISAIKKLLRPKVLVGNTVDLLKEHVSSIGQQWYIDDEQLNIINNIDVTSNYIPVVSSETGLLGTPTRESQQITFSTLMNPSVKIGALVQLISKITPRYNGIYKVETVNYSGDNYGADWSQTVTGRISKEFNVL